MLMRTVVGVVAVPPVGVSRRVPCSTCPCVGVFTFRQRCTCTVNVCEVVQNQHPNQEDCEMPLST